MHKKDVILWNLGNKNIKICRKYYCSELLGNDILAWIYPVNSFERNGYENVKYIKSSSRYIPMPKENVCDQWLLEFWSDSTLGASCSNDFMKEIVNLIEN